MRRERAGAARAAARAAAPSTYRQTGTRRDACCRWNGQTTVVGFVDERADDTSVRPPPVGLTNRQN